MENQLRIPLMILNWNGVHDTALCLEHVSRQTYKDLEVIVVDNGSESDQVSRLKELEKQYPEFTFQYHDENLGFVGAYNLFFEEVINRDISPSYVLLLNNDAFPESNWAEQLIHAATESNAGMVASKMINHKDPGLLDNVGHDLLNTAEVIPRGSGQPVDTYLTSKHVVGACAGACLYSVSMLKDMGLFDPYFATGYEDAEMGVRALVLGYPTLYAPEAVVQHKISSSIDKVKDFEYVVKTQVNIFYTYLKLMPWLVILVNVPFIIFKYLSVLLINALFGRRFFQRVMLTAMRRTLTSERRNIQQAREAFHRAHRIQPSLSILRRMRFFLYFDIKRFYAHMIQGKRTQFERLMDQ